ncbi:MAG TPA: endonuclease/exonuclease/phosphatase family protein [Thermoanaerobaculia bacterium]|nr:endonuclease/exonuclease/phosphatase family protein [Thermoanaerobaculia bacterium]
MEKLRVLSYNIHGRAHLFSRRYLHWIAGVIEATQPDIVGLQEVHRGGWIVRYEDQAKILGKLTGMEYHFGRSMGHPGEEFGNAVLTRGEIRSSEIIPLPAPGAEPRTVLHSRIGFPGLDGNTEEIDFYVTHLAHGFRSSRPARSLQAQGLLERLRQSRGPFVLVGDFNAPPHAPELKTLMAAEIFRLCGKDMACTHRILRQRIDWVVADPGWTTSESRVVQAGPSDHWPVLVELHRTGPSERR